MAGSRSWINALCSRTNKVVRAHGQTFEALIVLPPGHWVTQIVVTPIGGLLAEKFSTGRFWALRRFGMNASGGRTTSSNVPPRVVINIRPYSSLTQTVPSQSERWPPPPAHHKAIPVVLDLVHPIWSSRRVGGKGGNARLNTMIATIRLPREPSRTRKQRKRAGWPS